MMPSNAPDTRRTATPRRWRSGAMLLLCILIGAAAGLAISVSVYAFLYVWLALSVGLPALVALVFPGKWRRRALPGNAVMMAVSVSRFLIAADHIQWDLPVGLACLSLFSLLVALAVPNLVMRVIPPRPTSARR